MKTVYYDVENTLNLPFITGIQRVVREFSKAAMNNDISSLSLKYVPVVYDHRGQFWRQLNGAEKQLLMHDKICSMDLFSRLVRRLKKKWPLRKLMAQKMEPGSVFLDIESSWHSKLKRSQLLPELARRGVTSVKFHYDIIPILFPDTSHPNTIEVFSEHLASHLKYSELFLCISNTTRKDLENYCEQHSLAEPRLKTIELGTDLSNSAKRDMQTLGQPSQYGRYVLSVGTIEPRKNFTLLLKAFETLAPTNDLNLVIVGKIGWKSERTLEELQSNPLFGKRVFHLENVSDEELNVLYERAWLNVIPSLYEGFGLPVVEALTRNRPTLCSDAGSLAEFDARHVMFFKSDSLQELTSSIAKLDTDPTCYAQLVTMARNFKPRSWRETVRQIDDSLNQFLEEQCRL